MTILHITDLTYLFKINLCVTCLYLFIIHLKSLPNLTSYWISLIERRLGSINILHYAIHAKCKSFEVEQYALGFLKLEIKYIYKYDIFVNFMLFQHPMIFNFVILNLVYLFIWLLTFNIKKFVSRVTIKVF